jgi:hypothetical protein
MKKLSLTENDKNAVATLFTIAMILSVMLYLFLTAKMSSPDILFMFGVSYFFTLLGIIEIGFIYN